MNAAREQDREPGETIRVAVIVAHPDDETIWAGGLLLSHPEWSTCIVTLCRGKDPDRAPKFHRALERLGAIGAMGDVNDGPAQVPLPSTTIQDAILTLLPWRDFDLLLTHAPDGEYTWHRRHGEVSRAVRDLWWEGRLRTRRLWQFAYEDGGGAYSPQPQKGAGIHLSLSEAIWARKTGIISDIYGFSDASWEFLAAPRVEAFNCFGELDALYLPGGIDRRHNP